MGTRGEHLATRSEMAERSEKIIALRDKYRLKFKAISKRLGLSESRVAGIYRQAKADRRE